MKRILGVAAFVLAGFAAQAVFADDGLLVASNDLANVATLAISGNDNALSIDQDFDGVGGGNHLDLSITGDDNGGPLGAFFGGLPAETGLVPGSLFQSGHDNSMSIKVAGISNIFAASQLGVGNTLTAVIVGNNNEAAVSQTGNGNMLSFSQNGSGNMLSVVQRSR
jgi:hypothetical protein